MHVGVGMHIPARSPIPRLRLICRTLPLQEGGLVAREGLTPPRVGVRLSFPEPCRIFIIMPGLV